MKGATLMGKCCRKSFLFFCSPTGLPRKYDHRMGKDGKKINSKNSWTSSGFEPATLRPQEIKLYPVYHFTMVSGSTLRGEKSDIVIAERSTPPVVSVQ